jgi:GNAT superfamily N-acetyltransferase
MPTVTDPFATEEEDPITAQMSALGFTEVTDPVELERVKADEADPIAAQMRDLGFSEVTDPEELKQVKADEADPIAAQMRGLGFAEVTDPTELEKVKVWDKRANESEIREKLDSGRAIKRSGVEKGFLEKVKGFLNDAGEGLSSIISNPENAPTEGGVQDFLNDTIGQKGGREKARDYLTQKNTQRALGGWASQAVKLLETQDAEFEAAGITDPKDRDRIFTDRVKEKEWTAEDKDTVRKLSTGEIRINPAHIFGRRDEVVAKIIKTADSKEDADEAIGKLDAMRSEAAATKAENLWYADKDYQEVENRMEDAGVTDKAAILDAYSAQQRKRGNFAKFGDMLITAWGEAGTGIAKTAVGTAAGIAALVGDDATAAELGGTQRMLGEAVSSSQEASNIRGLTGGFQVGKDLISSGGQMAPMLIGGWATGGLKGITGAVTRGMAVYGTSAAQGYESKLADAVSFETEKLGRDLTEDEIAGVLGRGDVQTAAFLNAAQTALLSKIMGGGVERAALGKAAQSMTVRDFITGGGMKALKDGTLRKELGGMLKTIRADYTDEMAEEAANTLLDGAIDIAVLDQEMKLGDLLGEAAYGGFLGGPLGGLIPQGMRGRTATDAGGAGATAPVPEPELKPISRTGLARAASQRLSELRSAQEGTAGDDQTIGVAGRALSPSEAAELESLERATADDDYESIAGAYGLKIKPPTVVTPVEKAVDELLPVGESAAPASVAAAEETPTAPTTPVGESPTAPLQPAPVATEQPTPVATEQPTPVATEQPTPVATEQPTPVATEQPAPAVPTQQTQAPVTPEQIQAEMPLVTGDQALVAAEFGRSAFGLADGQVKVGDAPASALVSGTAPAPESVATPTQKENLPEGSVVFSDVYKSEGNVTIIGKPFIGATGGLEYPAMTKGGRSFNLAAKWLDKVISTPSPAAPSPPTTEVPTGSLPEGQTPTSGDVGGSVAADDDIRSIVDKADAELPTKAQDAITRFTGFELNRKDDPSMFGIMDTSKIDKAASGEDLELASQLETAFSPVRETLRQKYGDTITLYRSQKLGEGEVKSRQALSWTLDPQVADAFAGVRDVKNNFSEQEISDAEKEFAKTGRFEIRKGYWLEKKTAEGYGDYIAIMSDDVGGEVTDTGSVREFLEGLNEDRSTSRASNDKKKAKIRKEEIPLDDVMWVTDRGNQMEFIVRTSPNRPSDFPTSQTSQPSSAQPDLGATPQGATESPPILTKGAVKFDAPTEVTKITKKTKRGTPIVTSAVVQAFKNYTRRAGRKPSRTRQEAAFSYTANKLEGDNNLQARRDMMQFFTGVRPRVDSTVPVKQLKDTFAAWLDNGAQPPTPKPRAAVVMRKDSEKVANFKRSEIFQGIQSYGGIMSFSEGARQGIAKKNSSEWNDAPEIKDPQLSSLIYNPTGGLPSSVAQFIYDSFPGALPEPTTQALWAAIDAETTGASKLAKQESAEETRLEQGEAFTIASEIESDNLIAMSELQVGDRIVMDGEELEVTSRSYEDGYVKRTILKGGKRFGTQVIEGDIVLPVESVEIGERAANTGFLDEEDMAPEPTPDTRSLDLRMTGREAASWVIRNKETREVIMETFDRKKVDALNTEKYEAVPIGEYLASLNERTPDEPVTLETQTLETQTPESIEAEKAARETRDKIAEKQARPLTGSAGDLTADMFGEGETPLFNERRDTTPKPTETPTEETPKVKLSESALKTLARERSLMNLAGDRNAVIRATILSELTGTKVPKSKAGINALEKALGDYFGIDPKTVTAASFDDAVMNAVRAELNSLTTTPPIRLSGFRQDLKEIAGFISEDMGEVAGFGERPNRVVTPDGVTLELEGFGNAITLLNIETPEGARGQGLATKTMQKLIAEADKYGVTLRVVAEPFGRGDRMTKDQLMSWYGRFGFESEEGSDLMTRQAESNERFQMESDAAYFAAVERGDVETAQQMVDEAAREAGYDSTRTLWRGDAVPLTQFRGAVYLSELKPVAEDFQQNQSRRLRAAGREDTSVLRPFFVKANLNLANEDSVIDGERLGATSYLQSPFTRQEELGDSFTAEQVMSAGFDGVEGTLVGGDYGDTEVAVFSPENVKSADPVTYDAEGNVIPLSERFNPESPDIRYQDDTASPESIRHAELEAKFNAGTITPEETAEAEELVNKAIEASDYTIRGARIGFYHNGIALEPSGGDLNFVSGYFMAEGAGVPTTGAWSVSKQVNLADAESHGFKPEELEQRSERVVAKASNILQLGGTGGMKLTPEEEAAVQAEIDYQDSVNSAYSALNIYGKPKGDPRFSDLDDRRANARGSEKIDARIVSYGKGFSEENRSPGSPNWKRALYILMRDGRIQYDAVRGIGGRTAAGEMASEFIVPNRNQIKSAEPFTGVPLDQRFNPASPDIRYQNLSQRAKGSTTFNKDGTITIRGNKEKADFSTVMHELMHAFEGTGYSTLSDSQVEELKRWAGEKGITKENLRERMKSEAASEKLARGWESYIASGRAPLPSLQAIFDKMAKWMLEIYGELKGSAIDVEIPANIRAIFDSMAERVDPAIIEKMQERVDNPSVIESDSGVSLATDDGTPLPPAVEPTPENIDAIGDMAPDQAIEASIAAVRGMLETPAPQPAPTYPEIAPEGDWNPDNLYSLQERRALEEAQQYGYEADWKQAQRSFGENFDRAYAAEEQWKRDGLPETAGTALLERIEREGADAVLSDQDIAHLNIEGFRRKIELDKSLKGITQALETGSVEQMEAAELRYNAANQAYQQVLNLAARARTASGLSLNAWKQAIREDFTPATLYTRQLANLNSNRVKNGEPALKELPAEEIRKIIAYSEKMLAQQAALRDAKEVESLAPEERQEYEDRLAEQDALIEELLAEKAQSKKGRAVQDTTKRTLTDRIKKAAAEARERLKAAGEPVTRYQLEPDAEDTAESKARWFDKVLVIAEPYIVDTAMSSARFADIVRTRLGQSMVAVAEKLRIDVDRYIRTTEADITGKEIPSVEKIQAELNPEIPVTREMVYELAKAHVFEGARKSEVMDRVTATLQTMYPDITRDEVSQLFTDYGKQTGLKSDELAKALRTAKSIELVQKQIDDLTKRKMMMKTGRAKDDADIALRELRKKRDDLAKSIGYNPTDPKTQLASAQSAAKRRMENEIAELQKAIDSGNPRVRVRRGVEYTEDMKVMRERLTELRESYNTIFGRERTDAERNAMLIKDLDRRIAKEEDLISKGLLAEPASDQPAFTESPEVLARREKLAELRQQNRDLHAPEIALKKAMDAAQKAVQRRLDTVVRRGAALPKKPSAEPTVSNADLDLLWKAADAMDDYIKELRKNLPLTPAQEAKAMQDAYDRAVQAREALKQRIAKGEIEMQKPARKIPLEERTRLVRQENAELQKQITQMQKDAKLGQFSDEAKEARRVGGLQARIAELRRKRIASDFTKKPRREPISNERIRNLELDIAAERNAYDNERAEFVYNGMTTWAKWKARGTAFLRRIQSFNLSGDLGVVFRTLGPAMGTIIGNDLKNAAKRFWKNEAPETVTRPSTVARMAREGWKALTDERNQIAVYEEIFKHPDYPKMKRRGFKLLSPHETTFELNPDDSVRINPVKLVTPKMIIAFTFLKAGIYVAAMSSPVGLAAGGALLVAKPRLVLFEVSKIIAAGLALAGANRFHIAIERANNTMVNVARWELARATMEAYPDMANDEKFMDDMMRTTMLFTGQFTGTGERAKKIEQNTAFLGRYIAYINHNISKAAVAFGVPLFRIGLAKRDRRALGQAAKMYRDDLILTASRMAIIATVVGAIFGDDEEDEETVQGLVVNPRSPHFLSVKLGNNTFVDVTASRTKWWKQALNLMMDEGLDRDALRDGFVVPEEKTAINKAEGFERFVAGLLAPNKKTFLEFVIKRRSREGGDLSKMNVANNLDVLADQIAMNLTLKDLKKIYDEHGAVKGSILAQYLYFGDSVQIRETNAEREERIAVDKERETIPPWFGGK